jgi:hypothetical protein
MQPEIFTPEFKAWAERKGWKLDRITPQEIKFAMNMFLVESKNPVNANLNQIESGAK